MSSIYLNPQPSSSPIPFQDFKGDQILGQIHDLASSNTSLSYTNFDMIHSYDEENLALEYSRHPQEIKVNNSLSLDKPNNIGHMLQSSSSSSWPQNLLQDSSSGSSSYGYSPNHGGRNKIEHATNTTDQKYTRRSWKPSKVRIMQKMMANSKDNMGDQKLHLDLRQQQGNITKIGINNNEGNNGIRACSDCHTTTTPLWRSGPLGPKSLCNACGIRQRKARRAAMAAAAAASGFNNDGTTPICVEPSKSESRDQEVTKKNEFDNKSHPLPHKKRGKIVSASNKNYVGNNSYNNNNNINNNDNNNGLTTPNKDYITTSSSQRVFPRDEEEGAILLMALSCGLACSS